MLFFQGDIFMMIAIIMWCRLVSLCTLFVSMYVDGVLALKKLVGDAMQFM